MATESKAHPEKDQLIAFGQGRLPEDESSRVEQHLEVCSECCETLLDLKDDTFVGLIKVAKLTEAVGGPDLNSVGSGEITAQDTALSSQLSNHRTGYESEQAATLLGMSVEDSIVDELPPELADHPRYRIVGLLGRGGMGNVYRAEHRLMNRPVAIKLINSNLVRNRTAVERFRREVQAAAKLSHPNIVAAYDAEQAGDIHFLVMEFVEGTDLATVVKERGPMSVVEACRCIQQAANGLQHAHEKGMVHRDIKPHNLMLAAGGQVRILDFGLAGFAESTVGASDEQNVTTNLESSSSTVSPTQPPAPATAAHLTTIGSVMGTPDYMAPEQAVDAHSADIRADIYSLGCTLHFLLTGRPPFEREGIAAKLKAHASVSPPSLTEERSDVPVELSDIVARMMAKKPVNRFQSPDEVVAALEQFAGKPEKTPRRRMRTWVAGLLVLFAGVIFVQTDKGQIEIRSEVDDVKVVIRKGGSEIEVVDAQTGSRFTWFPSGNYEVGLKGNRNDVVLEGSSIVVRRWGRAVVTIKSRSHLTAPEPNALPSMAVAPFNAEQASQFQEAWAKHLGVPVEYTNSIGMKFRLIPPGEFMMGSAPAEITEGIKVAGGEPSWDSYIRSEAPQHKVTLTQPFYLGIHEVTQEQYQAVSGKNPSELSKTGRNRNKVVGFDTTRFPVEMIDWFDAIEFCSQLSQMEQLKPSYLRNGDSVLQLEGKGYRLPTEAQWEFACRAGTTTRFWNGDSDADLAQVAWLANLNNYRNTTVGQLKANPFGLFDVHGNVWEWIQDEWSQDYYQQFQDKPAVDPQGPQTTDKHYGIRGGIWQQGAPSARSAFRFAYRPTHRWGAIGMRVALPVEGVKQLLTNSVSDEHSLQGRWLAKSIKAGNGEMPAGAEPQWTMTFSGQSVQVTSPTGRNQGTFKLDVSKVPKEIDIEPTDGKGLIRGIYRFVGNELEVCIEDSNRKRPIEWDVEVGTRQMLIRLHRQELKRPDPDQIGPKDSSSSHNLIADPSFENTPLTQLPNGWRAWLNDGPEFRCEVVAGGHIGQRCLRISGKGTRGVVFANDLKVDRTKRYALKGWAKFEGDKNARAIIKLNYFRGGEFLGVHDLIGASADQPGWHLFEKTDTLDAFPTADHFYAMCHVEGSGTGWFDDLELIAYDRDKLPKDFDARHGRHNRLHGPNSLHRWIGTWDMEYAIREFDNSPTESKLSMMLVSERTLGDYFLLSHAKSFPVEGPDPSAASKHERLQFLLFDQNLGAFRQWVFNNQGKAIEWRGPWKNDKQTLELRALPDSSNLYSAEHFVDDDRIEARLWFQYVMGQRDAGRWTATRKAFDGKVDVPIAKTHATEPAELSQLNKFAGEWTIHAKYKPSVWNPLPREETIRETSVWVLGGRFLMTRCFNEKDELTSIWIAIYEPKEKTNRFWGFNADGSGGESRLTWDEASNGFQFRAVDLPDGWSGTGFNRCVDEDTCDNQAVIKDESGRVMLDMTQERRRKK